MEKYRVTAEYVAEFRQYLYTEERSAGTVEKYLRDIRAFARWLDGQTVNKELVSRWKDSLLTSGYAPTTVNSMLAAVNAFFRFAGWTECRVKALRIQRRLFRESNRELTQRDYHCLIETARNRGRERLALLMEAICATGIRASEVQYLTVESARHGRADLSLKGKIRTILLPAKLCRKLLNYTKKQKIVSGEIFCTRNGTGMSRKQIWSEMKALCRYAGIAPSKVFPHNLRHLFAQTFYNVCHDVVKLADVLGHSSIETTRIYLVSTGTEHEKTMARLGLVL